MQNQKLTIAVQKSGRLSEGTIMLLQKCGINVQKKNHSLLIEDNQFGVDCIFTRDDDIPVFVEKGICDLGIIGENLIQEYNTPDLYILAKLGFAKCRLSLAFPEGSYCSKLSDLNGRTIATSYPKILSRFLNENTIKADIITLQGSVELAPRIGISDCVFDLVSSGKTLKENGLIEFKTVANSEAILIKRKNALLSSSKKQRIEQLLMRMRSVLTAENSRYIMMHLDRSKLSRLKTILSGSESPTILKLQGESNKVAVHVVSKEDVFWETIEILKSIGASSILILPIEKMIL